MQVLDVHAGYSKVGGSGTVTAEFAVGGAAVGFTTTADNFRQADAATHPLNPPFAPQAPPQVISAPPAYSAPPSFGVRDGNAVDEFADVFDDGDIPGSLARRSGRARSSSSTGRSSRSTSSRGTRT
ncbi:hypothetical protein [Streptomyces sp. NPDC058583]|uniref:hypothetical protein n=1 Tax=Streptomyces sp. NPDC058583 TaxID=3346549 RepID=UPI00364C78AF